MTKKQKTVLGFAAGVTAGVSYGLNPLFGKPLLDGGVPVLSLLFFRYAISAVILGLWMAFRHESFRVNGREMRLLVVLGCLFAASSVFLFESYRFIPSGLATTFVYLYPVFVALIMVGLHVYPKWQVWLSIAATVAGVVLLSWPAAGTEIHWLGIVLLRRLSGDCQPLAAYQTYLRTHAHVLWSGGGCHRFSGVPAY